MTIDRVNILLAEDDLSLAFMISDALEEEGYHVIHAADGPTALQLFEGNKIDLCLLDIMLPGFDGYQLAKKIRRKNDLIPLIFLSTNQAENDKIEGYNLGGDDYLGKPFSIRELLKKVDVFIRRTRKLRAEDIKIYTIHQTTFNYTEMTINTGTEAHSITQKEADLLKYFCDHPNRIIKRQEVLLEVWGKDDFFLGRSMDVYVTRIRKYLRSDPGISLETIHGIGYRFSVEAD